MNVSSLGAGGGLPDPQRVAKSDGQPQAAPPLDGFQALSPPDQELCRKQIQELAAGGRLFLKDEQGGLNRPPLSTPFGP